LDTTTVQVLNPAVTPLITLTPADRKWMDELVTTVDQSWNEADPERPLGMGWVGSEDFLRGKFEEYVCSLLACIKFGDFLENGQTRPDMLLSAPELESYNPASFNEDFLRAFKRTRAFEVWDRNTDEVIFDLVEPKHPMEGKTNPFEDVGIRLVSGLHNLHLSDNLNLAPTRDAIQRGLVTSGEGIWGAVQWAREEAVKRQRELNLSLANAAGPATLDPSDPSAPRGGSGPERTRDTAGLEGGSGGAEDKGVAVERGQGAAPGTRERDKVGETFLAGVSVARTGAATVAAGLGSFWGKARNSTLFQSPSTSSAPATAKPARPSSSSSSAPPSSRPASTSTPIESLSPVLGYPPARPVSPTPSTLSTTSSTKSSSLVTVNAGTPPLGSTPTMPNSTIGGAGAGGAGGFLKPLATAVAATPAAPSSSSTPNR
ncbi:hypothetical protein JCM10212_002201, partial [Sporobolomyces blumeae]